MTTLLRRTSLPVLFLILSASQPAAAGMIVVSGDANMGNGIDGAAGAPVNAGNAAFFTNVLGSGTNVAIHDGLYAGSSRSSTDAIHDLYNNLDGVTSQLSIRGASVTRSLLEGVDLFIGILPTSAYTADEISAFAEFLDHSGTLFFVGDNSSTFYEENGYINEALSALGSSMSIGSASFDASFRTTFNIDSDPLSAGVSSFALAYAANVRGGTSLLRTTGGQPFVAYERLIRDIEKPDRQNDDETPRIQPHLAPEPSSFVLWVLGTVTLAGALRLRKRGT